MSLSSLQLDAFHCVARTLNFSRAAKELHITQSALTQRIQNLEDALGLTLFVRHPRGVEPTPAGERLLRYCQARFVLEDELVQDLKGEHAAGFGGALRIAGYSTVMRSVVLPALAPFLRDNRRVQPFLYDAELRELPDLLLRGEADYIVLDRPLSRTDVETVHIGDEENVLVSSREHDIDQELYLDHDPDDTTTIDFMRRQGAEIGAMRRGYLDEIYGIMDGVAFGLGKAVIPRHLASQDDRLKIVRGIKSLRVPVYLQFFKQPFYTKMHDAVVAELERACRKLLR